MTALKAPVAMRRGSTASVLSAWRNGSTRRSVRQSDPGQARPRPAPTVAGAAVGGDRPGPGGLRLVGRRESVLVAAPGRGDVPGRPPDPEPHLRRREPDQPVARRRARPASWTSTGSRRSPPGSSPSGSSSGRRCGNTSSAALAVPFLVFSAYNVLPLDPWKGVRWILQVEVAVLVTTWPSTPSRCSAA